MKPPTESRGVVAREDAKKVLDLCGEIFRPRRGSARPNRSPSPRRDGRGRGADAGVRQGPSRASRTSAFGQVRSARQQRAAGGARRGLGEYPDLNFVTSPSSKLGRFGCVIHTICSYKITTIHNRCRSDPALGRPVPCIERQSAGHLAAEGLLGQRLGRYERVPRTSAWLDCQTQCQSSEWLPRRGSRIQCRG